MVIQLFPCYSYSKVGIVREVFPYDCSVGGEVNIIDESAEERSARFRDYQLKIQTQEAAEKNLAISALTDFHLAFCSVEYDNKLSAEQLVVSDELPNLVESLIFVSSRQDISNQHAHIAAQLALKFSSYIADAAQRTDVRRKAIKANLRYAVNSRDAALIDAFFDEQVRVLQSQKKDQIIYPYKILDEIKKELGEISIDDLARVNPLAIQRTLYSFVAKFPEPEISAADCIGISKEAGKLHAFLIGIEKVGDFSLRGPVNDIKLLQKTLEIRGFKDIRMAANVTRRQLITQMRTLVTETNCGDSILFHYSGIPAPGRVCSGDNIDCQIKGWNSSLALADTSADGENVLFAAELSQFISAIRNRGANVLMIIDTNNAADLNLFELQKLATPQSTIWTGRLIASDTHVRSERDLGNITQIQEGAGAFAVFYATDSHQSAYESDIKISEQDTQNLGYFTYSVARVLQTETNPTVRDMLLAIQKEYVSVLTEHKPFLNQERRPRPVLDASAPDMRFFQTMKPIELGTLDIEILSPEKTRGVRVLKTPKFKIIGRLINPQNYANLTVDLKPIEVASNGQFSVEIELSPGKSELQFMAIDYNYVFHTKRIEFELSDDLERLAGEGNKYALIIGNQNYIDNHFKDLKTPHRDAEDIAALLRDLYGFKTAIPLRTGSKLDLILLDAAERQIQSTLRQLRNRLTENDTLIIYYAGHGVYQKDIDRAYWLPVDAEPDADYTWIKATDLTDTLKQFTARNILVVADSCYSGAMAKRDVPELKTLDEDRRKALLKAATRKSRILISSGGTEPVLDSGGGNHSVFALAFITALKEMDKDIFSSQEMYSQYIYPMVQGNENQEPQHKELEQSGHEGGDVIFWHTIAENAKTQ